VARLDIAVRALASAGPSVPAINAIGYDDFCDAVRDVIAPIDIPSIGIRVASKLGWVTADAA
jgi:hypothetical protein